MDINMKYKIMKERRTGTYKGPLIWKVILNYQVVYWSFDWNSVKAWIWHELKNVDNDKSKQLSEFDKRFPILEPEGPPYKSSTPGYVMRNGKLERF